MLEEALEKLVFTKRGGKLIEKHPPTERLIDRVKSILIVILLI